MFQLGATKALGLDGFFGMFYQKHWNIMGETMTKAVQQFFLYGILDLEFCETNVVLILKIDNPEGINHFRPISLCNFSYKIISKIMVNKMKHLLPSCVSHYQSGFIPGRQIQDNTLIAHECFHYLKLKKRGSKKVVFVKVDMNKAFDRVDETF